MTLQERKLNLINQLVLTNNENFISKVEELLRKSFKAEYEKKLKSMTYHELVGRINKSEEEIQSGKLIAHESIVKYFRNKKKK